MNAGTRTGFAPSCGVTRLLCAFVFIAVLSFPSVGESVPISVECPDSVPSTDREFVLTTDPVGATCLGSGSDANDLNANAFDVMQLAGWTILDKDEAIDTVFANDSWFSVTGLGATSGTFTIDPDAWSAYGQLAIGFVVGGGQIPPKWAVFELPANETDGLWSNSPQQGGALSHANLYGMTPRDITAIPEPATLLLLGSGLTVAMRRLRRRP